jgi:hypothetical protein
MRLPYWRARCALVREIFLGTALVSDGVRKYFYFVDNRAAQQFSQILPWRDDFDHAALGSWLMSV